MPLFSLISSKTDLSIVGFQRTRIVMTLPINPNTAAGKNIEDITIIFRLMFAVEILVKKRNRVGI